MRIGVISDTHIPKRAKELPGFLLNGLKGVDHIIHAGDIMSMAVIEQLEKIAPVTAVAGNADPEELSQRLGEKKIITFGRFRIGIFHGHGKRGKTLNRVLHCFQDDEVHCMIFGHSHIPVCQFHDNILLFNPGSPTDKRSNPFYSFGMIEIHDTISANLVYFDKEGRPI